MKMRQRIQKNYLSAKLGIPLSTVYGINERIENVEGLKRIPGSGRPAKLSDHEKKSIAVIALEILFFLARTSKKRFEEKHTKIVNSYRQLKKSAIQKLLQKSAQNFGNKRKKRLNQS